MEKIMEKVKKTRILAAIGIVCLILGVFFAYVKISVWGFSQTISLRGYWEGYIIIIVSLINVLIIFRDFVDKYIPKLSSSKLGQKLQNVTNPKITLISTAIVVILLIYLYNTLNLGNYSDYIKYGLGFYALWLGIILLTVYPFVYKGE